MLRHQDEMNKFQALHRPNPSRNQCFFGQPTTIQGRSKELGSLLSHKSKYTNSSKLTQSQLSRVLSKNNLKQKQQQLRKIKQTEVEILENTLNCAEVNEKIFIFGFAELLEKYSYVAEKIKIDLMIQLRDPKCYTRS